MLNRLILTTVLMGTWIAVPAAENWPQWRGPALNGVSGEKNLPVRWSKTENIAWTLALPAWSGSTPVIWGDRIFLNIAEGGDLYLWCVDRARGAGYAGAFAWSVLARDEASDFSAAGPALARWATATTMPSTAPGSQGV